jgi:hypothetical protein
MPEKINLRDERFTLAHSLKDFNHGWLASWIMVAKILCLPHGNQEAKRTTRKQRGLTGRI